MCIFSLAYLNGETVFVVECPNQAVAKRLSRKTYPFRGIVYFITDKLENSDGETPSVADRTLFCYKETKSDTWRCFDTSTNSWHYLTQLQPSIGH
jgi:hypothetical protein